MMFIQKVRYQKEREEVLQRQREANNLMRERVRKRKIDHNVQTLTERN